MDGPVDVLAEISRELRCSGSKTTADRIILALERIADALDRAAARETGILAIRPKETA